MVEETEMTPDEQEPTSMATGSVFIQLALDDFQRTEDGSWITTKQVDTVGPGEPQRLLPGGRRFTRGQMTIFGLDLAAILEKQFI